MRFRKLRVHTTWVVVLAAVASFAPIAQSETYKQLPPPGIKIDGSKRQALSVRVDQLTQQTNGAIEQSDDADAWRADVQVLIRAVKLALEQDLFYKASEADAAAKLLDEAQRRLTGVAEGKRGLDLLRSQPPAVDQPTLVVGGFISSIDDSVQPYALVLPRHYENTSPHRLDVWLHGRGDTKLEVAFLTERMTKVGPCAPVDTIVLHPFGRHCNAFKFAGETDVFESLGHVRKLLNVDPNRIAIRGFSMGGAGCWHLAAHHPTQWFAANPGAGFVDTIVYQQWTDKMPFALTDARAKTMKLYDVLPWTANLQNTYLIAYSGEIDKQRQAADRVLQEGKKLGFDWDYVIGKGMGHKIDAPSRDIIDTKLAVKSSEPTESPRRSIDFRTYTLRYAQADWLTITGLVQHWSAGHVNARMRDNGTLVLKTDGVTHLRMDFADSQWGDQQEVALDIDGERFYVADAEKEPGLQCDLVREQQWTQWVGDDSTELRKRPGLQGPIDDAFQERFVFVVPSRPAAHGVVQRWMNRELAYAQDRWRRLMRGNVRVVKDVDLTDEQIATNHLVCFGDFVSNRYLNKVAGGLPLQWTRDELKLGDRSFDPATHAAVFCFPNPKNPARYLVVNSGMTFREFSNVSNSRQIAMLPDWAVLKVDDDQDRSIFAGEIAAEGFFDESWQLPTP